MYELDDEKFFTCPAGMLDDEALEVIGNWFWMQKGFLPVAGGIDDQYERDLELMTIVDVMWLESQKDESDG